MMMMMVTIIIIKISGSGSSNICVEDTIQSVNIYRHSMMQHQKTGIILGKLFWLS